MKLYTINDLNRGAGVFDHVMRTYAEFPSYHENMPGADAIGVVGAAVKSGLNHKQLEQVLGTHFDGPTAEVLLNVWQMYTGPDPRIHLWSRGKDDTYHVSTLHMQRHSQPTWQLRRNREVY